MSEVGTVGRVKKQVSDMSGFCRFNDERAHGLCHGRWETPSAIVTCSCPGHTAEVAETERVIAPKAKRKIVAKKSRTTLA